TTQHNKTCSYSAEIHNPQLKWKIIMSYYCGDDPLKKKVASTLLESFLFYSGFYLPMYLSSRAKLTNPADIIRLIIRDESVHGYYIGYNSQPRATSLSDAQQQEYKHYTPHVSKDLYEN